MPSDRITLADLPDDLPALVPAGSGAVLCENGQCRRIGIEEARKIYRSGEALVAHAGFVAGRLKTPPAKPLYDVLELFAFVRPNMPCVPSAGGIARALGFSPPATPEGYALALREAATTLLADIANMTAEDRAALRPLVQTLTTAGWRWANPILHIIGEGERAKSPLAGFDAWRTLKEWEDEALPAKPSSHPVGVEESRARLAQLVGFGGEARPEQRAYADAATYAFGPREHAGAPKMALVEAGTGIGKTLGYLAPASLWAEKNGPGLWISTYTRNLQRQIVQEIARLYPDPAERAEKAVVRKGRENYLCLLNFEEAAKRTALAPGQRTVALALIARWIGATADGDMSGAGFPAFLAAPSAAARDHRPARRMHLCRLPALPHLLHRARDPARAPSRPSSSPIMRW